MKKKTLLVFCISLFLAGCNSTAYAPTGTQTAGNATQTPTNGATFSPESTHLELGDFPDRVFVGEDESYSIYIIHNSSDNENVGIGDILVYEKATSRVIQITGPFNVILGVGTLVYDDGQGGYILLSVGTYAVRNAIVLDLQEARQAVNNFCIVDGRVPGFLFWNHYVMINNCDRFDNRPWGAGEAPSIVSIDLETGAEATIASSDLTHQYDLESIAGNTLTYMETYVNEEADWSNPSLQLSEERTYDLSLLEI
jgi:hypothetical protein